MDQFSSPLSPKRDLEIDSTLFDGARTPTYTSQPRNEVTLHLREIPAHEIRDPQVKELSGLLQKLEIDSVFIASDEIHRNIDLGGTIIGDDWELKDIISQDNHSDLYSANQRKIWTGSKTPFIDVVNAEYEARVFTFDGVPHSVAISRKRNLKRFVKSVHVLCTQHHDGRTILLYKPNPQTNLSTTERQAKRHQPVPTDCAELGSSDNEEHRNTQRNENKRSKQQKRRQRQRETKKILSTSANETVSEDLSKAELRQKYRSKLKTSLKFVFDLYDFDKNQIDITLRRAISDEPWESIVQGSPTLKELKSPALLLREFDDGDEMYDFVEKVREEISELKKHNKTLPRLWPLLDSRSNDDWKPEPLHSDGMDPLNYVSRLLPLLIDAAERRQTKLEKRALLVARATSIYRTRHDEVEGIGARRDLKRVTEELKYLVPGTPGWNELRKEQKKTEEGGEYYHAIRLKAKAVEEVWALLRPRFRLGLFKGLDDDEVAHLLENYQL